MPRYACACCCALPGFPRQCPLPLAYHHLPKGTKLELGRGVHLFDGTILDLSQSWQHGEELAPIFSGACWAGTVVWQAALDLCDFMSKHFRKDLAGATVVELGCGIGVPGMIARLLGATVILTEQDELLSLLDRNIASNFFQDLGSAGDGGTGAAGSIRRAALDWERTADADGILASLNPSPDEKCTPELNSAGAGLEDGSNGGGSDGGRRDGKVAEYANTFASDGREKLEAQLGRKKRPDIILCADCVFEPLYGDSWKALAKVMGRLSDTGTTVLCSVERRGEDGVPQFLSACVAEGFKLQLVFLAAPDATSPVEIYELSRKGDRDGFRCKAVGGGSVVLGDGK